MFRVRVSLGASRDTANEIRDDDVAPQICSTRAHVHVCDNCGKRTPTVVSVSE